uniref:Uncharacterized protein n=1 Tax=Oryza glumipatula TaxID=40148 RepID=A0A0E0B9N9_9ORYZ
MPVFPDRPRGRGHGRRLAVEVSSSGGRWTMGEIGQRRVKSVRGGDGRGSPTSFAPSHGESALAPVGSRRWRPWPRKAGMGMVVRIDGWMDVQFVAVGCLSRCSWVMDICRWET